MGLPHGRERVGVRQVGLNLTDDRAEKASREKPRPEGTGRILTDRRQLSQGGSGRSGHAAKLPANLLPDSIRPVSGGQSSGFGGIRGSTQGMRAHIPISEYVKTKGRRHAHSANGPGIVEERSGVRPFLEPRISPFPSLLLCRTGTEACDPSRIYGLGGKEAFCFLH
jgi:hypothetical protein